MESGLFALQLADLIIAWLCVEDDGCKEHAKMLLKRRGGQTLSKDVVENLQGYYYELAGDATSKLEEQRETIVMLVNELLNSD